MGQKKDREKGPKTTTEMINSISLGQFREPK